MPPTPSFCEKQNTDGIVLLRTQNVKNETFTKIKREKTRLLVEPAEISASVAGVTCARLSSASAVKHGKSSKESSTGLPAATSAASERRKSAVTIRTTNLSLKPTSPLPTSYSTRKRDTMRGGALSKHLLNARSI